MPNIYIGQIKKGRLEPGVRLRIPPDISGNPINFAAPGWTLTANVINLSTGSYIRQNSTAGLTGNSDGSINVSLQAGDTDTIGPTGFDVSATDSNSRKRSFPKDGLVTFDVIDERVIGVISEYTP